MIDVDYKSRLQQMALTTPSALWNDSCSLQELASSIELNGAVGATCNPVIVLSVLKKEWPLWKDRIPQLIRDMPTGMDACPSRPIRSCIATPRPFSRRRSGSRGWPQT